MLYLTCRPGASTERAEIEMRHLEDGRVALMAYSALDRLEHCCGPHQPWVLYRTEELGTLKVLFPYDVVLFDQPLPEEVRYAEGEAGSDG